MKPIKRLPVIAVLLLLPLAYWLVCTVIGQNKGPYWLSPNQDPDYAYLFNSLAIANGLIPTHIDHPGTVLQLLGAGILWLGYMARAGLGIAAAPLSLDVILTPELYLHSIDYVIFTLTALALLASGWVTWRVSGNLLYALMLQVGPLTTVKTTLANEPSRVAPEGLLFAMSQVLVMLLVLYLFKPGVEKSKWFAVGLGAVFGVGMATKVTVLPTIFFFFLILGIGRMLLALLAAIAAFVVATLPIISKYDDFFRWLFSLAISSEQYGRGDRNPINFSYFQAQIIPLIQENEVFLIITLLLTGTGLLMLSKLRQSHHLLRTQTHQSLAPSAALAPTLHRALWLSLWLSLATWLQIMLALNESGASRYLTPAVGLVGLMALLLLLLLANQMPQALTQGLRFNFRVKPGAIALAMLVMIGIFQIDASISKARGRANQFLNDQKIAQTAIIDPQYAGCAIIYHRRASALEAALFYGDYWVDDRFSDLLMQNYPDVFFSAGQRFFSYQSRVRLRRIYRSSDQRCALLQIRPTEQTAEFRHPPEDMHLENLFPDHRVETVYLATP